MDVSIGSIVYVIQPTLIEYESNAKADYGRHGFVYEIYEHNGHNIYVVLMKKSLGLYDMKSFKPSTQSLSDDICVQHLDEYRLKSI